MEKDKSIHLVNEDESSSNQDSGLSIEKEDSHVIGGKKLYD